MSKILEDLEKKEVERLEKELQAQKEIVNYRESLSKGGVEERRLTIISKEVKDPHYESYISLSKVSKKDKNLFMLSYYLKEMYLGRYLIKRNSFFTENHFDRIAKFFSKLANATERVREKYYADEILNSEVPVELQNLVSDLPGDIEFERENNLGTTVNSKQKNYSEVYSWFYREYEKSSKRRESSFGYLDDYVTEEELEIVAS